jgi:phage terminase large subunit-like protein
MIRNRAKFVIQLLAPFSCGVFEKLEDEQCSYVPEVTRKSPNGVDALVCALTELYPEGVRLAVWESLIEP